MNHPVARRTRLTLVTCSGLSAHTTAHHGYAVVLSSLGRTA